VIPRAIIQRAVCRLSHSERPDLKAAAPPDRPEPAYDPVRARLWRQDALRCMKRAACRRFIAKVRKMPERWERTAAVRKFRDRRRRDWERKNRTSEGFTPVLGSAALFIYDRVAEAGRRNNTSHTSIRRSIADGREAGGQVWCYATPALRADLKAGRIPDLVERVKREAAAWRLLNRRCAKGFLNTGTNHGRTALAPAGGTEVAA
jgi:hypothetical protein